MEQFELTFYLSGGQTVVVNGVETFDLGVHDETGEITGYNIKLVEETKLRSVLFVPGEIIGVTSKIV